MLKDIRQPQVVNIHTPKAKVQSQRVVIHMLKAIPPTQKDNLLMPKEIARPRVIVLMPKDIAKPGANIHMQRV